MPKIQVSDPITDQEIAFAHMVLSGTMTDRRAAEAVGLNPDTAAHVKAKPGVRAYMLEHRAAIHQQRVQQETDLSRRAAEGLRQPNVSRERVLTRLWELADLSHEATRNGISSQIKALSLIIAIEGLIPDRRAGSAEKKFAEPPAVGEIYKPDWLRERQGLPLNPRPSPDLIRDEEVVPPPSAAADAPTEPASTAGRDMLPGELIYARDARPAETTPPVPPAPASAYARDMRVPYTPGKNPFARGR